jgi:peptidoglycan/xylan/chitin deacetylase (PgdA/CDA1 family)
MRASPTLVLAASVAVLAGGQSAHAHGPSVAPRAKPVPVLMYHRVSAAPRKPGRSPALWVGAARFRRQLGLLARAGYHGVTLDQVWRAWHRQATLPDKPIVLTFDDGYASQYRNAAPALRRYGWPGVLNLEWRRLGLRGGLSRAQVRRLIGAGWEVAAHSLTHPDLTRLDAASLRAEVAGSRAAIEHAFGLAVESFCYPYGRVDARVRAAVRAAGFRTATTTRQGLASPLGDPLLLRRIRVDGRKPAADLLRALRRAAVSTGGPMTARHPVL